MRKTVTSLSTSTRRRIRRCPCPCLCPAPAPFPRSRRNAGLTLLEVLAAAMIFAMVMTVLVGTSSTAVHRSGQASKQLEANLVADAFLADLEIQINQRIAPVIEEADSNRDDFTIQVQRVSLLGEATDGSGIGLNGFGDADAGSGAGEIAGLLAGDLPEVVKHLYQYDLNVSWVDSSGVQSVTRTTFAFDWQAAALEFAELFQGAGEEGTGEDTGEDASESDAEFKEAEALDRLRQEATQ